MTTNLIVPVIISAIIIVTAIIWFHAGKKAGRSQIMKVISDFAVKDAEYVVNQQINNIFDTEDTKKKITKEERQIRETKEIEDIKMRYKLKGLLELYQAIEEIL